jgi:hypothetical protein
VFQDWTYFAKHASCMPSTLHAPKTPAELARRVMDVRARCTSLRDGHPRLR